MTPDDLAPEVELIGVPFDGYGRTGNQARAASALREAGLFDAFEAHHVVRPDQDHTRIAESRERLRNRQDAGQRQRDERN